MSKSSAGTARKAQPPSSITAIESASGTASRSRRPVVTCTGPPIVLSAMPWRAASACRLVMPGTTRRAKASPPAARWSRMRSVLS